MQVERFLTTLVDNYPGHWAIVQEGERHTDPPRSKQSAKALAKRGRLVLSECAVWPLAEERKDEWPQSAAAKAAAAAWKLWDGPKDGVVAVKVQYPDAAPVMALDLVSIRKWADFISKTEIKFDLVSAVDELSDQVKLEFDFVREARIMDTVAKHLRVRGFEPWCCILGFL